MAMHWVQVLHDSKSIVTFLSMSDMQCSWQTLTHEPQPVHFSRSRTTIFTPLSREPETLPVVSPDEGDQPVFYFGRVGAIPSQPFS